MAEEASRSTNSLSTIKSGSLTRRNSLPLFRSDLGKDVPGYLRASTGSCHDHCKYGRREMCEVMPKRPAIKRPVTARGLKASDKPQLGQNDLSRIHKPQILPSNKTPEASSKQGTPRAKDTVTKSSEGFPKPAKSKLLKEKFMTRKSDATSGNEKLKREKEIVPGRGNLRDAKTNSKSNEGGNLTKSAKGSSINAAVKLNAKAKPSPSPAPRKMVSRVKPLSSSSPPRVRPVIKARPQSSPTKLKPVSLRVKSSSSPTKSRPVSLRLNASSSPTKLRHVNSSSSPIKLKPVGVKVNSLSSPGSFKLKHATAKTSPPSISSRNVSSKKSIIIRSQFVKTGKSSKERATETVATRPGSESPDFKDTENSENEELQQENKVEAQIDEKKELQQENLAEAQIDENKESQLENLVEDQIDENKEVFEENEEALSHETELQSQEELSESFDEEAPEKTLYVIQTETGNDTQPASNAEDKIPEVYSLTPVSPPQTPSSPFSVTESNMTTAPEASLKELTDTDTATAVPSADQETPDFEPLPSLSPDISPESQSSIVVLNEASLYEVSLDGSVYTDSEEGYSSYEDEHLVEGENLKGDADNIKVKTKSVIVTSQENSKDPVKLRFRRGRVIDITDENHCPRKLKFRRARVLDEKAVNDLIRKRSFKMTDAGQVDVTEKNNSGSVVLRHQDMQDKKDAQVLFNNVIEETASKLVEKRKSMVKALVGAFETVISLQDGKPATTQQDE